jgi:WD40 repeat protein
MKKIFLFAALLASMACSSLAAPQNTPAADALPTLIDAALKTASAATATTVAEASTASPTAAGTAVPSATFTRTPLPTSTPLPSATPVQLQGSAVIGAQNAAQVKLLADISNPETRSVIFSPDGSLFAASSGNESNFAVRVWRSSDGAPVHTFEAFQGIVWNLAFSPDSQLIAAAADDPAKSGVRILGMAGGAEVQALGKPQMPVSAAFSPDGKVLAVGGLSTWPNGIVWLYDTSDWSEIRSLPAPGQNVLALKFSADGSLLAGGGSDGKIRLWNTARWEVQRTLFHARQVSSLAISPDGQTLVSNFCTTSGTSGCEVGGMVVWNINNGSILHKFSSLAETAAFSPDGSLLAAGSGANERAVRLWNTANWTLAANWAGQTYSAAFSPDGKTLATSDFTDVRLWGIKN